MKKDLLTGLVALLLLLAAPVSPIVAQGVNSGDASLTIEKITFVHYLKDQDHSKPVWDDTVTDYRLIAGGVRWFKTIKYQINPTSSGLTAAEVLDAIKTAAETWDSETSFELFDDYPILNYTATVGYDGYNTITWGSLDPGVIAVTTIWYYPHNKTIVEFDMKFNALYTWQIYPYNTTSNYMDLQNIATHELGHNGLADLRPLKDAELTMYYASSLGEIKKRSLGVGDILGIQALYGA
jgi:hypothetical protein